MPNTTTVQYFLTHSISPTPFNSTQLNSTQLNSTQLLTLTSNIATYYLPYCILYYVYCAVDLTLFLFCFVVVSLFRCFVVSLFRCFVVSLFRFRFQYSGGQATEGQGGYYGSGGSRVIGQDDVDTEGRNRVIAMAADVQRIQTTVTELDGLENLLRSEEEDHKSDGTSGAGAGAGAGVVTTRTIELKNSIKKLITSKDVVESLNSLEIQGSPVWGLSTEEREMIVYLRDKMNES
jgi:hypothetical protein